MSEVAEAATLAFFREAGFESDFTARHLLVHLALVRDHHRLRRSWVELHNSGDNDNHDQQRIYRAYSDSDAHPDAYTNSDSRTNAYAYADADTYANAHTRYSDNYVRR